MQTARRSLLACLPVALAPAAAGAFRLEAATAEVEAEYASSCSEAQLHEALVAELDRRLDGRPLPPELAPKLAELTRCPFCGCALAGAADHGETASPTRG